LRVASIEVESGTVSMEARVSKLVDELLAIRTRFGPRWGRRRERLLRQLSARSIRGASVLRRYHELLLFHAAYPDRVNILRLVEAELRRIAADAHRLAPALADSGIAGTVSRVKLSHDAVAWLERRHGRDVAIDWEDGSAGPDLDEVLPLLMSPVERDGFLTETLSTRDWLRRASGNGERAALRWLLDRFRRAEPRPEIRDRIFESAEIALRWRLRHGASRTGGRFPARPVHFQADHLRREFDLRSTLAQRLPAPRRLSPRSAWSLIDSARAALFVRQRETDAVTYANPRETMLFALERGFDVAIFGTLPGRRLPIESFFGFVLARNCVPIGYGGGWVFYDRCEIGINVFDTFRGGETAFGFAQVMRVYRQYFGARRFLVDPFQFGADNDEAIRSGAFWFYYRLGFRPVDRRLRERADAEAARISANRRYRTPPALLRRFARAKLSLDTNGNAGQPDETPDLHRLGQAVTRRLARGGRAAKAVAQSLVFRNASRWPSAERAAFEMLCPLVALIPDLHRWPRRDRLALIALMRAKGGPRERHYVRALRHHDRFRRALDAIAGRGSP
jgi:hypothetical protein